MDYVAVVGLIIGLFTWALAQHQSRRESKLAHTADVVAQLSSCDALREADLTVRALTRQNEDVGNMDERQKQAAVILLDYYEFLSALALSGNLDRPLVAHLRGDLMLQCHRWLHPFMTAERDRQRRKADLWTRFSAFVGAHGS